MGKYEEKLASMGYCIPPIPPAAGSYIPALKVGKLVYCSGQGAFQNGKHKYTGRVGREVTIDQAVEAAQIAALNCLAEVCSITGSIDKITRIVQVRGFVNSTDNFHDQPKVINGTSDFLKELFGTSGEHVRSALGTSNLPGNIPVEVEMIVEIEE
ncbi:MAG: RidA family protein [Spirochaetia bacterium]|nr:RidA family protein [Spirochaetia bacterium]